MGAGTASSALGAQAVDWPVKPVRVIVPYAAGQGTDITARYLCEQLVARFGQPFVVENRPGAGGNIGTLQAARAPADGYTLILGTNATHAAAPFVQTNIGFDPASDFEPIALIGLLPLAFAVAATSTVEDVPRLIRLAREKPDQVDVAWSTLTSRVAVELFKELARAPVFGIGYKASAQAIGDLIGGQVAVMVDTIASIRPQIANGRVRAIAVTSSKATELLPGVHSVAEQGIPNYSLSGWNAMFAPRGTPNSVIRALAAALIEIAQRADGRQRLLSLGAEPLPLASGELSAFLRSERETWLRVVQRAQIRVDG
jgi:tripartite-type tricarboxylate transporter receptor subunit TctC